MPEPINSPDAPEAIGPYSHATRSGNHLFTSGQIPIDPATGSLVADEIEAQAEQVFANLKAVLASAGADFGRVVKTTVFLKDMAEFPKLNAIYAKHFGDHKPARSTVQVACLPLDCRVEIDAIAELS